MTAFYIYKMDNHKLGLILTPAVCRFLIATKTFNTFCSLAHALLCKPKNGNIQCLKMDNYSIGESACKLRRGIETKIKPLKNVKTVIFEMFC